VRLARTSRTRTDRRPLSALAIVAVLLGSVSQSVSGIGFSLVSRPFFLGLNVVAAIALGRPDLGLSLLTGCVAVGGRLRVPERVARRTTLAPAAAGWRTGWC
jgi:hypothetical protein